MSAGFSRCPDVNNIYLLVPSTRLEKDFDALRISLAARQKELEPNITAQIIGPSEDIYNTFFQAGARIDPNQIPTTVVKRMFRTRIRVYLQRGIQTTVNFYFKSLKVLSAFHDSLNALLAQRNLAHISVVAIAIEARKEIMTTLGVDRDDVIIEVEDQMKNVQVVTIDQIRATL